MYRIMNGSCDQETYSDARPNKDVNTVKVKEIIDKIELVEKSYEESTARTKHLLSHVNRAQNSINKVSNGKEGHSWGSLDKTALLGLIIDVNKASSKSVSSLSDLIKNNNENSKLLAEMISALTILSGLSFEKIQETTEELNEIASHINESSDGLETHSQQIGRIILSQIEKIKKDKKRANLIEYNFEVIHQKLRENEENFKQQSDGVTKSFHLQRDELTEKVKKIESETVNAINDKKTKINLFFLLSITNLLIIVAFIIYFILKQ